MAYVQCRVCGKVLKKSQLKDECPACGAKAQAFEDYTIKISDKRKKILDLHLHPILVHLPEAIAIFLSIASFILVLQNISSVRLENFLTVIGFIFPFSVLFAMLIGLFDAKIRFERLKTKYILLKIILGVILEILSICLLIFTLPANIGSMKIGIFILSMCSLIVAGLLGKIGGEMICSYRKE